MAQLVVRKLEDTVVRNLKKRAAEHGVSAEEEHRRILRESLLSESEESEEAKNRRLWEVLASVPYKEIDDIVFEQQRDYPSDETVDFSE